MEFPKNRTDEGSVIGYKPKLEYNKEINNHSEAKTSDLASESVDMTGNIEYSKAITDFEDNMPSKMLEVLDMVRNNINSLISKISPLFSGGKGSDYSDIAALLTSLQYGNTDFSRNFIDYHFNEISGSHIPEIINELFKTGQRLDVLSSTIKELFYGNPDITTEEAAEKDNALLKKMQSYEESDDIQKINYAAVAYDNLVGRSTTVYGYTVNKAVVRLNDILLQRESICLDPSRIGDIKHLFKEVNDKIEYRKHMYNTQQSVEIMQKTLYNYYNRRSELMTLYDIFSSTEESLMFGTMVSRKQDDVRNAIEEISKTYMGNQFYLNKLTDLEQEKYFLRDIYAGFNYNS